MSVQAKFGAPPANETWLQELQSFATEFQRGKVPPESQGDGDTRSVKYRASFSKDEGVSEKGIKLLEDIIKFEELLGNYWIDMEALLVKATLGRESPIKWLSKARRCARLRMQRCARYQHHTLSRGVPVGLTPDCI